VPFHDARGRASVPLDKASKGRCNEEVTLCGQVITSLFEAAQYSVLVQREARITGGNLWFWIPVD
jgi:hypothetical protein